MILTLIASDTIAEVCDKERPLWNPASGAASVFDEFVALIVNPLVLVLLAVSAGALTTKRRLAKWVTALLWLLVVIAVGADYFGPILDDVRWEAMREGCIGSPLLFLALAIAICATLIHGALRPRIQEKIQCSKD